MEDKQKVFVVADSLNQKFKTVALSVLKQYETYDIVVLDEEESKYEFGCNDSTKSNLVANLHKKLTANSKSLAIVMLDEYLGFQIEANKNIDLRCSSCLTQFEAFATRSHNHSNILLLTQELIGEEILKSIIITYISTPCSEDQRHVIRVSKLTSK